MNGDLPTPRHRVGKWPTGFRLKSTLRQHHGWIGRIAWSPDGCQLASGSDDRTICVWNRTSGASTLLEGHEDTVFSVAWGSDGRVLASGSDDETVILWETHTGQQVNVLRGHASGVVAVAWLPGGILASGGGDKSIRIWDTQNAKTVHVLEGHTEWVRQLALSSDGQLLASASYDGTIRLWDVDRMLPGPVLRGHTNRVHSAVWCPDGSCIASSSKDLTIRIWSRDGTHLRTLEGHTGSVYDLSFSCDGALLASKALDSTVRIWRCSDWTCVAVLDEETIATDFGGLAFHPTELLLATLGEQDTIVRLWQLDTHSLSHVSVQPRTLYTSAKIVIVGESNVGKSCLALRLGEHKYAEQTTTHGMRFWLLSPEQLDPQANTPPGEHRDVILWDMGGQDEYRLIHQMFLHDTTVALILVEPTRGRSAFDEVEDWNRRLEKQLHGRLARKLLVGAKLDDPATVVDESALRRLVAECGFSAYYPTSSKLDVGIAQLRSALSEAIDWASLAKTSRPDAFQQVHAEIAEARDRGEAVLLTSDLEQRIRRKSLLDISTDEVSAVIEQLALQGVIATTTLASGDRALVLLLEQVEQYGASLILMARANPRGVPAVEERALSSRQTTFPRIKQDERLAWPQERAVLECVVQLLIEHDICLRHEGVLVFPSLFQVTESGGDGDLIHAVSLYYDFTGAIDNIYASLVARLSLSLQFGRYRLWKDRAEWELPTGGACGLRKVSYISGVGHLDVYFADNLSGSQRELFLVFVEDHLREEGVEITETLQVTCICGGRFQEEAVRGRLAAGKSDIICPVCERRRPISEGARQIRTRDPKVEKSLVGLKTIIDRGRQAHLERAREALRRFSSTTGPVRILHLSDLHMNDGADPITMLQQLLSDLRDPSGLGIDRLDYLFVTGDLTDRAAPVEFQKAYEFVSGLIESLHLNAARCVIVPGNHDVDWDENVYEWHPLRSVNISTLRTGTWVRQGDGVLLRNEKRYPLRFKNFSERFYKFLTQEEYPRDCDEQAIAYLFPEASIQLLACNSCYQIDEFFADRAGISSRALSRGLMSAENQLQKARADGSLPSDQSILRMAIWHHPVTGNGKIIDDAFLDLLRQADFRFCLHGHVHEDRADLIGYVHPGRHVRIAGAGSFGAPAAARPESVPRLYNLIEIASDRREVKVHTRCQRRETGAWDGWAVWDGDNPHQRLTYYRVSLT